MFDKKNLSAWTMLLVAFVTVAACVFIKYSTGGWEILLLPLMYVLVCVAHLFFHFFWAWAQEPLPPYFFGRGYLSNLLFALAFLLDIRWGDGTAAVTITILMDGRWGSEVLGEWLLTHEQMLRATQIIFVCAAWALLFEPRRGDTVGSNMFDKKKLSAWTMLLVAFVTVAACVFIKYSTGGWEVTLYWPMYALVCIAHLTFHLFWASAQEPLPPYFFGRGYLSNVLFGLAFLLDISDGDNLVSVTITRLLDGRWGSDVLGEWLLTHGQMLRATQIIFVCAAWALLFKVRRGERK